MPSPTALATTVLGSSRLLASGRLRGKRVGIVSVSASSLTPAHLEGAGVPLDAPIAGTENGREFFRVLIKGEKQDLDVDLARQDVVEALARLQAPAQLVGAGPQGLVGQGLELGPEGVDGGNLAFEALETAVVMAGKQVFGQGGEHDDPVMPGHGPGRIA